MGKEQSRMASFNAQEPEMQQEEASSIKQIMVAFAMEAEAQPLIDYLGLSEQSGIFSGPLPAKCYSGEYKECNIHVVVNGKDPVHGVDNVGTVSAALTTYLGLQALSPDLLINAGTCGGFKRKGAEVGDVFLSTAFKNHDRRIAIPGFTEWGIGNYNAIPTTHMQRELGFKSGIVSSGNSLDCEPKDDEIISMNDASVKEMEAAAIASTAHLFQTPFFAIKVVTDIVDGDQPTHEEFLQNLGTAARSLQEAVPKVIDFVLTKKNISEL
mmetsp:Transcript_22172/g.27838  ORF Transcript_22172/g.27838 Transcript_22172/m.27838 type:complete len:268 (+) Transcript_22172:57-860(+)